MNWALVAALAAVGLVTGWCLRGIVFRQAVPAGTPPAMACPGCGREFRMAGRLPGPTGPPVGRLPGPTGPPAGRLPGPTGPPAGRLSGPALSPAGRCAGCRSRLGPPPLSVELVTAVLFGALAARVHPALVLAAACWLAACCVALAWIDADVQRLPDVLTVPAYAGTAGLLLLAAGAGAPWPDLLRALLGGLALAACYLALVVISRSAIGLGDAKLAASLGTLAAWASWPTLVAGAFAGFLLGAVYGAALLLSRRAHLGQAIAFGPFMIAGIFLAVLAGAG